MNMIRVLVIEADGRWEFKEISNTLTSLQQCVGGDIEAVGEVRVSALHNAAVFVNDNGKNDDLPVNDRGTMIAELMHLLANGDTINGPMVVAMSQGEDLVSMNNIMESTLRRILA